MERGVLEDTRAGHYLRAIDLARRALDVDSEADHFELALVRLSSFRLTGSHAAAAERYAHDASVMRQELGMEPPPFESL